MIKKHEQINLSGHPLFTRITLQTPTDVDLPLPADACFTFIISGDRQSFSERMSIAAIPNQVILSFCGLTFGQMLAKLSRGSIEAVIVHFNPALLKLAFEGAKPDSWEELEKPVTKYVVQTAANQLIQAYFDGILRLFENRAALDKLLLKLKLQELILLLLRSENAPDIRQIVNALFSDREFTFKEKIDAYVFEPVSIEELAMITNCSLSTFKRRFRQIYHTSPARYMKEKRLKAVAHRLRTSAKPIAVIGYDCGFTSPEQLSRDFRKLYGMPPSEYRLSHSVR